MSDTNKKAAIATAIVLLIIAAFWTGFMEKTKKYTISEDFDNITVYGQNSSIKVCSSLDDKAYVKNVISRKRQVLPLLVSLIKE